MRAGSIQEAALAMKYGDATSEEEALKMITINPAWQIGLDKRIGSLEVGKDGDVAIFNGHPFAPASRVEMTIIDGKVYFDRDQAMTLEKLLQRWSRPRMEASHEQTERGAASDSGARL